MAFAKGMAAKQAKGYIAPFKAIEAMERGLTDDFEADLKVEAELFTRLRRLGYRQEPDRHLPEHPRCRPVCRASKRSSRKKSRTVAMLGGGVMGSGIVNLLLRYGFEADPLGHQRGGGPKGHCGRPQDLRLPHQEGFDDRRGSHQVDAGSSQDHHLSGRSERGGSGHRGRAGKHEDQAGYLEETRGDLPARRRSSGPTLRPCRLPNWLPSLRDPGRMIGLHFFNPAERMQLLEIICGKKTSDQTLSTSVAFGRAIRKVPIVVNDGAGILCVPATRRPHGRCPPSCLPKAWTRRRWNRP